MSTHTDTSPARGSSDLPSSLCSSQSTHGWPYFPDKEAEIQVRLSPGLQVIPILHAEHGVPRFLDSHLPVLLLFFSVDSLSFGWPISHPPSGQSALILFWGTSTFPFHVPWVDPTLKPQGWTQEGMIQCWPDRTRHFPGGCY